MRALVPCAYTSANKGDAVLVETLVQVLVDVGGPGTVVEIVSQDPERDTPAYGRRCLAMPLAPDGRFSRRARRLARRLRWRPLHVYVCSVAAVAVVAWTRLALAIPGGKRLLGTRIRELVDAARAADVVVAAPGGYLMAPKFLDHSLVFHTATLGVVHAAGKRIALSPCSVGPFPGSHRLLARLVFRWIDDVVLRERESLPHARGAGARNVRVAADLAFAYEPAPCPRQLPPAPAPNGWLAVSVRTHHFEGLDPSAPWLDRYLDAVADAVHVARDELGLAPVVVLQVGEDRAVTEQLLARLDDGTHRVLDDLTTSAIASLYGECALVLGTRMHANVLAMRAGTPAVAIAYEHKTTGIMAELGLGDYVVAIEDTPERLVDVVRRAWADRGRVREVLSTTVAEHAAVARAAVVDVVQAQRG